jgi:ribosome recycling factor
MQSDFKKELTEAVDKGIDHLKNELSNIHTGRANVGLISDVPVEVYGVKQQLKQVANITITDPRSMAVQPWDKGNTIQIEAALRDSGLGFGVANSGEVIRVTIPELTQERRDQYAKLAKEKSEEAKITIRTARQSVWDDAKKAKTASEISEDEMYYREAEIQKIVETKNKEVDDILSAKEAELKEV